MKLSCCSLGKNELIRIAMSDHRNQDFIELLKHIAHPIRLKLLQILTVESEILTSEIIDIFTDLTKEITDTEGNPKYTIENPQPFITRQLTKLKKSGILETKKYRFTCENDEWKKISDDNGKIKDHVDKGTGEGEVSRIFMVPEFMQIQIGLD